MGATVRKPRVAKAPLGLDDGRIYAAGVVAGEKPDIRSAA
jgi:hypothetical protein